MFICCMTFLAVVIASYEHSFQFKHSQRMIIVCDKAKDVRARGRACVCMYGRARARACACGWGCCYNDECRMHDEETSSKDDKNT